MVRVHIKINQQCTRNLRVVGSKQGDQFLALKSESSEIPLTPAPGDGGTCTYTYPDIDA